jgi:hypothetical protein
VKSQRRTQRVADAAHAVLHDVDRLTAEALGNVQRAKKPRPK